VEKGDGVKVGWGAEIKGWVVGTEGHVVVGIEEKKNGDEFDEIGSWNEENFEQLNVEKMVSVKRRDGDSLEELFEVGYWHLSDWQKLVRDGRHWGCALIQCPYLNRLQTIVDDLHDTSHAWHDHL